MSCLCFSERRSFMFFDKALNLSQYRKQGCSDVGNPAKSLTKDDYELIRRCNPSTKNRSYRIHLIYDWKNSNRSMCINNTAAPYFWGGSGKRNRRCVDGKPLMIVNNTPAMPGCHVPAVFPGSSSDFFYNNIGWTPCWECHSYICSTNENSNVTGIPRCDDNAEATAKQNNQQANGQTVAISIGTAASLLSFIILIAFLICKYLSKKRRKGTIRDNNQQEESHCNNGPGFLSYNRNSSHVSTANRKVNERDLYEFAATEIYDASIYSEIEDVPHQQRTRAAEYEECLTINPGAKAETVNKIKDVCHYHDAKNEQYCHLIHLKNAEESNKDYQSLSLNSISPLAFEIEECQSDIQDSSVLSGHYVTAARM